MHTDSKYCHANHVRWLLISMLHDLKKTRLKLISENTNSSTSILNVTLDMKQRNKTESLKDWNNLIDRSLIGTCPHLEDELNKISSSHRMPY